MHIPFAPRILIFSFFQTASSINCGCWQKKKVCRMQVGRDQRDAILCSESYRMKNVSMKSFSWQADLGKAKLCVIWRK